MKKWQCFCACACVLALAITAKAQESDGQAGAPKLKTDDSSAPSAVVGTASKISPEDIDKRLSNLEKQLAGLVTQLIAMQPKLVTKDDVEKLLEQKLKVKNDSVNTPEPVTPAPEAPVAGNAVPKVDRLEQRISALETSLSQLNLNFAKIGQRLGVKISDNEFDGVKPIVGEIEKAVEQKRLVEREAQIIIRNLTADAQTLYVEAKEWRIPGDGREYEIPVKLIGTANSVVTQVWPFDRPKVRQFKMVNGKLETRFDITLRPVE